MQASFHRLPICHHRRTNSLIKIKSQSSLLSHAHAPVQNVFLDSWNYDIVHAETFLDNHSAAFIYPAP